MKTNTTTANDLLLAAPREAWKLAERCAQQKITNLTRNGAFAAMYEAVQHEDAIAHLERVLAGLKADGIGKDALKAGFEAHGKAIKTQSAPLIRLAASRQFEIVERIRGLQGKIQSADAIREEAIKKYRDAGLSLAKIEQIGLPHTAEEIAAWREEVEALRAEDTRIGAYLADWPFHDPRLLEGTTVAAAAVGLAEPEALAA
ncbi:MAG: hypothetical protein Q8M09_15685 [Pseudomonadota bacterium]|nr:hypothetical protein [Pseudomonadota bacterium]MDP1905665.1 hypothetical protein [Pseudomonadota bacterium]MDP2353335.1 hypothetical protein [Pseudomonadota bacterium]